MKYPAGHYITKDGREYLAAYTSQPDVFIKMPDVMSLKYVAHFSYEFGGKNGGVNVFQILKKKSLEDGIKIVKDFSPLKKGGVYLNKHTCREIEQKNLPDVSNQKIINMHNVNAQIISNLPNSQKQEIKKFTLLDIFEFCKGKITKNPPRTSISFVDEINPKTKVKYINPNTMLTTGKQEFVPACILEANIDFGQGCITAFIPGENPVFDGTYFNNYWAFPSGECLGCYAERNHRSFPKTLYNFDSQQLLKELKGEFIINNQTKEMLGKPIKVLRFGKRTEAYNKFTQENFAQTLEACFETNTTSIIPTKFLEFRKDFIKLLKNSQILYSIGDFDELEQGANFWGCSNEWRLEQAIKYKEAGVNSNIYLNIIGHHAPTQNNKKIIETVNKHNIKIQILPRRFKQRLEFGKYTGENWNDSKNNTKSFLDKDGGLYEYQHNQLSIQITQMHPEWLKMIGDNKESIRMCHHDKELTYCGGCFARKGTITQSKNKIIKRKKNRNKEEKQSKPIPLFEGGI